MAEQNNQRPLLEVSGLCKRFPAENGGWLEVVKDVSFSLYRGECVGLVGESGCGKSTISLMTAGLLRPDGGSLFWDGAPLKQPFRGKTRREIQILFQHPEVSFNPTLTLEQSMHEPFLAAGLPWNRQQLLAMLKDFGIYDEHLKRKPQQLSGGELQRLALARVLILRPRLLILDEPTSMLDAISQAQLLRLLEEKRKKEGFSCLMVTHDLELARRICTRILRVENAQLTDCGPQSTEFGPEGLDI